MSCTKVEEEVPPAQTKSAVAALFLLLFFHVILTCLLNSHAGYKISSDIFMNSNLYVTVSERVKSNGFMHIVNMYLEVHSPCVSVTFFRIKIKQMD